MSASSTTPPRITPATATGAATPSQLVAAQTRAELTLTLRRGESVLVTVIFPTLLLLFFTPLNIVPRTSGVHLRGVEFLLPGILAAAVMSAGMVSLGIATAYERYYGVLKRLGSSPLPRWGLIVAKTLSVLAVEVGQVIFLVGLAALFFGWRLHGSFFGAVFVLLLGTLTFSSLGMLMAGALRAEATLAGANGLYLLFLLIGGMIVPIDRLPVFMQGFAHILPGAALSDALRGALTAEGVSAGSILLLAIWAAIFLGAAAATFKWE